MVKQLLRTPDRLQPHGRGGPGCLLLPLERRGDLERERGWGSEAGSSWLLPPGPVGLLPTQCHHILSAPPGPETGPIQLCAVRPSFTRLPLPGPREPPFSASSLPVFSKHDDECVIPLLFSKMLREPALQAGRCQKLCKKK